VNLHWRPSLLPGFFWALVGLAERVGPTVAKLALWTTLLWPALVCAFSLREMTPEWARGRKGWLVPVTVCLASYGVTFIFIRLGGYQGTYTIFATPVHEFWATSLVILGAGAGLACSVLPRSLWAQR
jgi:hypothetical protein